MRRHSPLLPSLLLSASLAAKCWADRLSTDFTLAARPLLAHCHPNQLYNQLVISASSSACTSTLLSIYHACSSIVDIHYCSGV